MKKVVLLIISVSITAFSFSQSVFTYGKNAVSKDEFIRAFNKNPVTGSDRKKALIEYLDLYINFKLKVQTAYDVGLDKDATQQYELQNFKKQIADNIINDEANVKALIKQAFERNQKEIRLQQVFIEVAENGDTAAAYKKIQLAFKQLKQGKNFGEVVQDFSNDESTKLTNGDLGFITVFTLPYEMENIVYSLKPNAYSAPFKTRSGYHIFKNVAERKSSGSRRVAQILISVPPNVTDIDKLAARKKADSIYNVLMNGADFGTLALQASNDLSSSNNRGLLPEFTIGTYAADFENVAFSLPAKGSISKPFETAYGFHILKLIEAKPAPADLNDPVTFSTLREKVTKDSRLQISKKQMIQNKLALIGYKSAKIKLDDLFLFTDSSLQKTKRTILKGITENTQIFSFAKQNVLVGDWITFVKNNPNRSALPKNDYYKQLFKEYINSVADEYYRNNLESYNPEYIKQVKEFKEANLLFGIMEKNVWSKANTDTAGLKDYYKQHKAKYIWPASADALIVTCNSERLAKDIQQKIKNEPGNWRHFTTSNSSELSADSGRYELTQLPASTKINLTAGSVTPYIKSVNEDGFTFSYIIKIYPNPAQRSFDEARGMVISDYQQVLENKWLIELKKKYPVKINESVFQSIK